MNKYTNIRALLHVADVAMEKQRANEEKRKTHIEREHETRRKTDRQNIKPKKPTHRHAFIHTQTHNMSARATHTDQLTLVNKYIQQN